MVEIINNLGQVKQKEKNCGHDQQTASWGHSVQRSHLHEEKTRLVCDFLQRKTTLQANRFERVHAAHGYHH